MTVLVIPATQGPPTGTSGATVPFLNGTNTWANQQTFSSAINLTSGQIIFPAAQAAAAGANTLDDYEEGTWTPAFASTSAVFSYNSRSAGYTKIGNFVAFWAFIALNTSGNTLQANPLTLTGLPFTSGSLVNVNEVQWSAATTSYVNVTGVVSNASTVVDFRGITAAATSNATALNSNALLHATNGSSIFMSGYYQV